MPEVKSIFDLINNVNSNKELLEKEQVESIGNAYMINRAMSNNVDTIFFANEASGFKHVPLYPLYLFYQMSVPKKKRYGKWEKKGEKEESIQYIKDFYQCSDRKALDYIEILTDDQIKEIKAKFDRGGRVK